MEDRNQLDRIFSYIDEQKNMGKTVAEEDIEEKNHKAQELWKEKVWRCFKNFFLIVLHLNWQAIHKIALNLVSQVQYKRISKKRLMFRVAIEPTLFLDILFDSFFRFPSKVNAVVV